MRLDRLGTGGSTDLGAISCTDSCDLLLLRLVEIARSSGVGSSIFIGAVGEISGLVWCWAIFSGVCGVIDLGTNAGDCCWLVAR